MGSVSARLTLLFVLVTAIILGLLSVALYLWVAKELDEEVRKEVDDHWRTFSYFFVGEYDESRRWSQAPLAAEVRRHFGASRTMAEVRRENGEIFYRSEGFPEGYPERLSRTGRVVTPRGEAFVIRVGIDDAHQVRHLRNLRRCLAVFCPIVLIAYGLVGFAFVKRALVPVERIRRQAERISRASITERVPEPRLKGEFQDLARTFNEMLGRLEAAIQDLENFAADAAHELRSPLASLRAGIETALKHCRPEDERLLLSLAEEASRMGRVVSDLFTLAQLDMRQYALAREPVDLGPILDDTCETWQSVAKDRGIAVRREGSGGAVVAGDGAALRRVFLNLVENAVKYNRPGGEVVVSLDHVGGMTRVRVADTGTGIPAEHLPHLFRRFFRADKARPHDGGAGLGLAICKSFVEAHGGTISVESVPGKGSAFTVALPVEAPASPRP